jgi:predicted ribosomally synthesized peptide with nif11-like leader
MNEALIKEVFSDKEFVESLLGLETPEEVQTALKGKDLDLSIEDIENIQKALTAQENSELSEEEMENVAGGFAITAGIISAVAGVIGATAGSGSFVHNVSRGRW